MVLIKTEYKSREMFVKNNIIIFIDYKTFHFVIISETFNFELITK